MLAESQIFLFYHFSEVYKGISHSAQRSIDAYAGLLSDILKRQVGVVAQHHNLSLLIGKHIHQMANIARDLSRDHIVLDSVLRKAQGVQEFSSLGVQELSEKELNLIQRLVDYPVAVRQAGDEFSPAVIANYAYALACDFNSFYHDHSILNEADEQKRALRLVLAQTVAKVIKSAMALLGIEVPNRM